MCAVIGKLLPIPPDKGRNERVEYINNDCKVIVLGGRSGGRGGEENPLNNWSKVVK